MRSRKHDIQHAPHRPQQHHRDESGREPAQGPQQSPHRPVGDLPAGDLARGPRLGHATRSPRASASTFHPSFLHRLLSVLAVGPKDSARSGMDPTNESHTPRVTPSKPGPHSQPIRAVPVWGSCSTPLDETAVGLKDQPKVEQRIDDTPAIDDQDFTPRQARRCRQSDATAHST